MIYVSNAFSLNMLEYHSSKLVITQISKKVFEKPLQGEYTSAVGHEQIAELLNVPYNRITLKVKKGDVLYVAQYSGPRLPEGATELPDGATIIYYHIVLI